jgi:hypothetical protein
MKEMKMMLVLILREDCRVLALLKEDGRVLAWWS